MAFVPRVTPYLLGFVINLATPQLANVVFLTFWASRFIKLKVYLVTHTIRSMQNNQCHPSNEAKAFIL